MPHTTFAAERLARIDAMERWHFWFRGRRALCDRLLDQAARPDDIVLELGAGTGRLCEHLRERGQRAVALDLRPEGLRRLRAADPQQAAVRADAERLPFRANSFDGAVALDLLEHVEDEAALLGELARVLRPGGWLLLSVPAFPALHSQRDVLAGHRRRYSRRSLAAALGAAHLNVHSIQFYQCLLFPLFVASRLRAKNDAAALDSEERVAPRLNAALAFVNLLEVKLGAVVRWPFGSSLFALARRGGHRGGH